MSTDGLRELPPDQEVRSSRLRRLRLVPLIALTVLSVLAAAAGGIWNLRHPLGSGVPVSTAEPGVGLPDVCAPAFDRQLEGDPWGDGQRAASEAIWQEHAEGLAGPAVSGEDGQWFFGDAHWNDFTQALGREPLSQERMDAWYAYLNNMRAELAELDVPLYVVVAPAKWEILHDSLPEWSQPLRGEVRLDALMDAYPDLPFVDVRAAMAEGQRAAATYTPLNSHWTDYGAATAYGTLAACLAASDDRMQGLEAPTIASVETSADIDEFAGMGVATAPGDDWTSPVWAEPFGDMTVTTSDGVTQTMPVDSSVDMLQTPATTRNTGAQLDLSALVVRDSTGNAIGPLLQEAFAETTQIRHYLDEPASMPDVAQVAADSGADVAILVLTERYLDIVPGVGAAP